jgi:NAD(P)-dependent dehydrogenase (short-subunit alcohol dehydrogenase family)
MSASLHEEHAVVTGASRGIGAAIARTLAARGARLSLIGRNESALSSVAAQIGGRVATASANVADRAAVTMAFNRLREHSGPITVLVNNAGQARSAPFASTDDALWRDMLEVNLNGAFYCTQAVLPDMIQAGRGRVINIASTAGLIGYPYVSAYCAAKHAVIGLTRSLALELARKNVTVNAVCPGYTDTDLVKDAVANIRAKTGRDEDQAIAALVARNPQGRLIRPEEVAETVAWLCCAAAASITGQSIAVAGGEIM